MHEEAYLSLDSDICVYIHVQVKAIDLSQAQFDGSDPIDYSDCD